MDKVELVNSNINVTKITLYVKVTVTMIFWLIDTTIQVPFNHCDIFVATWGYVTPLTFAASCGAAADELFILTL